MAYLVCVSGRRVHAYIGVLCVYIRVCDSCEYGRICVYIVCARGNGCVITCSRVARVHICVDVYARVCIVACSRALRLCVLRGMSLAACFACSITQILSCRCFLRMSWRLHLSNGVVNMFHAPPLLLLVKASASNTL